MREAEKELIPLLEKEGRVILPDRKRPKHFTVNNRRSLPKTNKKQEDKDFFDCTVDVIKKDEDTGKEYLYQRRFYDKNGRAEQDVDYVHQNTKGRRIFKEGTHIFPHMHIWIHTDDVDKHARVDDPVEHKK